MMGIGNDIRTIAPYHARTALPLWDVREWISHAQAGQTFVLRDGPVSALPLVYRLWLEVWEDEGLITYEAVRASPAGLSSHHNAWRVHVTRTEAEL